MMVPKSSLALALALTLSLLLILAFSSLAVPSTRSLKSTEEDPQPHFLTHQVQDALMDLKEGEKEVDLEKTFIINGRMDLESLDYPGTGANNHHDPKTPGRP